ncbi:MAG: adenylosuccinate lyase [Candidatus Andersenbacteria bacterium]
MNLTSIGMDSALCPLDDRYAKKVSELRRYFSEPALIQARVYIELQYLAALAQARIPDLPFGEEEVRTAEGMFTFFAMRDVARIKEIEATVNHDVKAVEYWIREKLTDLSLPQIIPFVHFGLTSEDVTNLAYGVLISHAFRKCILYNLDKVSRVLHAFAEQHSDVPLLGMTHGQPATPTTVHDQIMVFAWRLMTKENESRDIRMYGKFGGAVGNYSAHFIAYPEIDWKSFGQQFVESLGLLPIAYPKQINPHDDVGRLSHFMIEVSTILLDLARDMWLYISRGVFSEKVKEGEVGSSTMPNKVNPLDWENAEGNLGIAAALFAHFAQKLPVSRMQRDLSDSTVQRWLGVAFGAFFLAQTSIMKGLSKLQVNRQRIEAELRDNPDVHAEAIQMVMRRFRYADSYERLKEYTRGKKVTREELLALVGTLDNVSLPAQRRLIERIEEHA